MVRFKRGILGLIIFPVLCISLMGCQADKKLEQPGGRAANQPGDNIQQKKEGTIDKTDLADKVEIISAQGKYSTKGLTLVEKSNEIDIDQDQEMETIEMYTTAQKEDGEIMWDDGNDWLLLVRDKNEDFVLFDGFVQLGSLQYWVYSLGEENVVFEIVTLKTGTAEFILTQFTFNKEKRQFTKKQIFEPDGTINLY